MSQIIQNIIDNTEELQQEDILKLLKDDNKSVANQEVIFRGTIKIAVKYLRKSQLDIDGDLSTGWRACQKACIGYNTETATAKFVTYYIWKLRGEIHSEVFRQFKSKHSKLNITNSLDEVLTSGTMTLGDILNVKPEPQRNPEAYKVMLQIAKEILSKRQFEIFEHIAHGDTMRVIAEKIGITHQGVSIAHKRSIEILKEHYRINKNYEN